MHTIAIACYDERIKWMWWLLSFVTWISASTQLASSHLAIGKAKVSELCIISLVFQLSNFSLLYGWLSHSISLSSIYFPSTTAPGIDSMAYRIRTLVCPSSFLFQILLSSFTALYAMLTWYFLFSWFHSVFRSPLIRNNNPYSWVYLVFFVAKVYISAYLGRYIRKFTYSHVWYNYILWLTVEWVSCLCTL